MATKKKKEVTTKKKSDEVSKEEKEKNIIKEGRIYAVIGYFWVLCFIPLMLRKNNPFAVHHGKNGLMLFLAWLACLVISIFPVLGHMIAFAGIVIIFILSIQGIIHSMKGEYWHMPVFGGYVEKLNI